MWPVWSFSLQLFFKYLSFDCMTSASKEHLNPERRSQPCVVLELALAFCDERAVEALQLT